MGMDTGGGVDFGNAGPVGIGAGEIEGLVDGVRPFADTDGEDGAHAGIPGTGKERVAVLVVAGGIEMGVGVDQSRVELRER